MSDFCASNLQRPDILQTWLYDATQSKLVPAQMSAFTTNIDHNQFNIGLRNSYKVVQVVDSSMNPLTVSSGGLYIAADDSTRVQFVLPLASSNMVYGDCFRFAGLGAAGYQISVISPGQGQYMTYAGFVFHTLQNIDQYAVISFASDQFSSNKDFVSFATQGRFTGS